MIPINAKHIKINTEKIINGMKIISQDKDKNPVTFSQTAKNVNNTNIINGENFILYAYPSSLESSLHC